VVPEVVQPQLLGGRVEAGAAGAQHDAHLHLGVRRGGGGGAARQPLVGAGQSAACKAQALSRLGSLGLLQSAKTDATPPLPKAPPLTSGSERLRLARPARYCTSSALASWKSQCWRHTV
jgi:hypothetical protein